MKKILTLGTLLLGCCLAVAQTGNYPNQTPQGAAPSAYPQDQTGQPQSNQAGPADPSALPPDSNAPGQAAQDQAAAPANQTATSQITTVEGCLSQSAGSFMLADNSGNNYQLSGDTSQLASLVGMEIQVNGVAKSSSASGQSSIDPGAMSSDSAASASPGAFAQIEVSKVRKIANVCSSGSADSAAGSSSTGK
jgi:hypothetical protein